jgi:4-diphosphocytidyl-2-C-methyl-D-erythritol kinase
MFVYPAASHVLVHTPAKINLFLEVLARRGDGFHEIESLMGPVTVFDTVEFVPRNDGELRLKCRWAGGMVARENPGHGQPRIAPDGKEHRSEALGDLPKGDRNLVHRAATRLRELSGSRLGASIRLTKRIPSASGLGGASSDAAAALVAANVAWRLHWPLARLAELAAELGSDVPFFLSGGWAVCRGRGERIEADRGGRLHVAVVRPKTGLSTPQVYGQCRPAAIARSASPLRAGLSAGDWRTIRSGMFNRLSEAATGLNPSVGRLQDSLGQLGCVTEQMSGSGSSCFGICHSARHARRVAAQLRSQRVGEVYQATMVGRKGPTVTRGKGDEDSAS